jgi:sugar lactone lactonase YvrE
VADISNHTVRKITPGGVVTTLAGVAGSFGSADGTDGAARFYYPQAVATDAAGNVYVADAGNNTIRKITPAGVVTTLAGLAGSPGSADGTGSGAQFNQPSGVATDAAGNVYVADTYNHTIRKITPAGVVSTLAGIAGSSGSGDGTGNAAQFNYPWGVATDSAGNVYLADRWNHTIRRITPAGVVTTLAGLAGYGGSADGTGSAARFDYPAGVLTDAAGNVYVADSQNQTIRKITPSSVVTTLAGLAASSGSADGTGSAARFYGPYGVASDSAGNLYVADSNNHTIRQISPAGVVSTLAGLAGSSGSADGAGSAARFYYPQGVATDSAGNLYVADFYNHTIRMLTPAGVVSTLAGLAGSSGSADGTGSAARFYEPRGVATDAAGNLYVADSGNYTIRQITPGGVVTTMAGLAGSRGSVDGTGSAALFSYPTSVATDSAGNVYVADALNQTIRKITPAGVVTTLAGLAGSQGSDDGTGSAARFWQPEGVATDSAGNVYVADFGNQTVRKITPAGVVTTMAGLAGSRGSVDGTGIAARFDYPRSIATDAAGNMYVADGGNNTIRKGAPHAATNISVTSTDDSGPGTLRAALASAGNGDTIDATGVSGSILLTSGELLVAGSVTVLGPGPANLAVNGNAASRVFNISGSVVTIAGLTITNGMASGSFPANLGGGIYAAAGTLTVSNCTLSGNSAQHGGGIYNDGAFGSATLTVSGSTLNGNSASVTGAGIYNDGAFGNAALTVSASLLRSNSSAAAGGGIYNSGAFGSATATVSASTLNGNSASSGAGIYNDGYSGSATVTMSASTLSGNSAGGAGAGIYNSGQSSGTGAVQILNSTLSGNLAGGHSGGGIYNDGTSSGQVTLTVKASTFSGNTGGIFNNGPASLQLDNTILNAGASGANLANASGTVNSDGYNLSSDDGGGFLTNPTDQINTDPMLGPLQDNGGPTFTHALLPGSPAIDQGKDLLGWASDQRGLIRTVDGPCLANASGGDGTDIGAFEVQQPCPVVVSLGKPGVVLNQFGFDIAGVANQVVIVEASTDLVSWTALATNMLGAAPLHFIDPAWTNFQRRFYRAKVAP